MLIWPLAMVHLILIGGDSLFGRILILTSATAIVFLVGEPPPQPPEQIKFLVDKLIVPPIDKVCHEDFAPALQHVTFAKTRHAQDSSPNNSRDQLHRVNPDIHPRGPPGEFLYIDSMIL